MALYQRKRLSDMANIGEPGPLPEAFAGLSDPAVLADLPAHFDADALAQLGFAGQGFFPVDEEEPATPTRWLHKVILLQRIPAPKRIAIRAAAKVDVIIEDFLDLLYQTDEVDLDNENLIQGLAYCQTAEAIDPDARLTADDIAAIRA